MWYCCSVSIRILPSVHFHVGHCVHFVLTYVVHEFRQGSVVSNRTRLLSTYWKWGRLVCSLDFDLNFIQNKYECASSAAAIFIGWWSLPFRYVAKMVTVEGGKCPVFHWVRHPVWRHLCTQNSKFKYGSTQHVSEFRQTLAALSRFFCVYREVYTPTTPANVTWDSIMFTRHTG